MIGGTTTPIAYTLRDAAAAVGMSPDYLRKEMGANRLNYKKIGNRISIPHKSLVSWYDNLVSGPEGNQR